MKAHGESERPAEHGDGERLIRTDAAEREDAPLLERARLSEVELELPDLLAAEKAREMVDVRACSRSRAREIVVALDVERAAGREGRRAFDR